MKTLQKLSTTNRRKAAKKAAETRATNRAILKRWVEIDRPAYQRADDLFNYLLEVHGPLRVMWNPIADTGRKLKKGVKYGYIVKFLNGGRIWRVKADGYATTMDYHQAFWELL